MGENTGENETEPKPDEVEKDPDTPKWIKSAMAYVGLAAAIVGVAGALGTICFGAWELRLKAEADKTTAETNLCIAREQAAASLDIAGKQATANQDIADKQAQASLDVANAQIKAHQQEYEFQGHEHNKEQRTNEEQRLSGVITDLLSDKSSSEGQLDILSSYVEPDHRYDEIIANAIKARLSNPRSESEIDLAFVVFERLDVPKARFLVDVNKNAKRLFDDTLLDNFWTHLASRTSATTTDGSVTSKSRDEGGLSPAHLLFRLVSDTESDVVHRSMTEDFPVGYLYMSALINFHFGAIMGSDMDPKAEDLHQKDLDGIWWQEIRRRLLLRTQGSTTDYSKMQRLAANLIERTSALLPVALRGEMDNNHSRVTRLAGCYLFEQEDWPEGRYPPISFAGAYIPSISATHMRKATFDQSTKSTLILRMGVHESEAIRSQFSKWLGGDIDFNHSLILVEFSAEPVLGLKDSSVGQQH